jgi:hypothetical protein
VRLLLLRRQLRRLRPVLLLLLPPVPAGPSPEAALVALQLLQDLPGQLPLSRLLQQQLLLLGLLAMVAARLAASTLLLLLRGVPVAAQLQLPLLLPLPPRPAADTGCKS